MHCFHSDRNMYNSSIVEISQNLYLGSLTKPLNRTGLSYKSIALFYLTDGLLYTCAFKVENSSQGCNPFHFAFWGKMKPTTNLEPAILAVGCELKLVIK